jgi:putative transposase
MQSPPYSHFKTHLRTRRLAKYDYSEPGWYFVTICCRGSTAYFGEIRNGMMALTDTGCIAHACWNAIPVHEPGVELGAFIVMPNHVHGLIGLRNDHDATGHAPSLQASCLPRPGSLSAIVGSYKSAVTRIARSRGFDFVWQARFHDHIVRNDESLSRINDYIQDNPVLWEEDRYYL